MAIPLISSIIGTVKGIFDLSPKTFSQTLDSYLDFHRVYLFRVMFFDKGIANLTASVLTTNLISQTDTPVSTTSNINLGWQGTKVKIAGKTDYQDWRVVIRDDMINTASTYIQKWRDMVYDISTGSSSKIEETGLLSFTGLSQGYKKQAIVILLANRIFRPGSTVGGIFNTALTDTVGMRAYLLHGIWPKEVGTIALDYSTEAIATLPITFSLDYFEPYSLTSDIASILKI